MSFNKSSVHIRERLRKHLRIPTNAEWLADNVNTGAFYQRPSYLQVYTGIGANSRGSAQSIVFGLNSGTIDFFNIDWTKRLELSFILARINGDVEAIARVQLKESAAEGQLTERGIGIQISNYTMVGESFGTVRGTVAIGALTDFRNVRVKIALKSGFVEFWVNDILQGVLTGTAIPSVAGAVTGRLIISIINGATGGVNAWVVISDIDIRQDW